jgi:hypothetical protein
MKINFNTNFAGFLDHCATYQALHEKLVSLPEWDSLLMRKKRNYEMALVATMELCVMQPLFGPLGMLENNNISKFVDESNSSIVYDYYKPIKDATRNADVKFIANMVSEYFHGKDEIQTAFHKEVFNWKNQILIKQNAIDYTKNIDFNGNFKDFLDQSHVFNNVLFPHKFEKNSKPEDMKKYAKLCMEIIVLNPEIFFENNPVRDDWDQKMQENNSANLIEFVNDQYFKNHDIASMYMDSVMCAISNEMSNSYHCRAWTPYVNGATEDVMSALLDEIFIWGKKHDLTNSMAQNEAVSQSVEIFPKSKSKKLK